MSQISYAPTIQAGAQSQSINAQSISPFADNWQSITAMGFAIHPLRPNEKIPMVGEWQKKATKDPIQCHQWAEQHPNANIGIATELSGIVVVDCDTPKGKPRPTKWQIDGINDGADVLAYCAEQVGESFPTKTLAVWTPSKGVHLYFRDEGRPIKQGAQVNGLWLVDTRSIGGNIVAPTSVLSNGTYQMGDVREIAPLPNWIRNLISPRVEIFEQVITTRQASYPATFESIEKQLNRLESASEGTRNDTLASVAFTCSLIVQGNPKINANEVMVRLQSIALAIGLPRGEAIATIKSCWGNAIRKGGVRNVG
jgi:hypothetical protein